MKIFIVMISVLFPLVASAANKWSCAAFCSQQNSITTSINPYPKYYVISQGNSAKEAFEMLLKNCVDRYADGTILAGQGIPSIPSACVMESN